MGSNINIKDGQLFAAVGLTPDPRSKNWAKGIERILPGKTGAYALAGEFVNGKKGVDVDANAAHLFLVHCRDNQRFHYRIARVKPGGVVEDTGIRRDLADPKGWADEKLLEQVSDLLGTPVPTSPAAQPGLSVAMPPYAAKSLEALRPRYKQADGTPIPDGDIVYAATKLLGSLFDDADTAEAFFKLLAAQGASGSTESVVSAALKHHADAL